jgi:hypothetical protein
MNISVDDGQKKRHATSSHDCPGKCAQGLPVHPTALRFLYFSASSSTKVYISDCNFPLLSRPRHIFVNNLNCAWHMRWRQDRFFCSHLDKGILAVLHLLGAVRGLAFRT